MVFLSFFYRLYYLIIYFFAYIVNVISLIRYVHLFLFVGDQWMKRSACSVIISFALTLLHILHDAPHNSQCTHSGKHNAILQAPIFFDRNAAANVKNEGHVFDLCWLRTYLLPALHHRGQRPLHPLFQWEE